MRDAMVAPGGSTDALRVQIEAELRAEARERRRRWWLAAGGLVILLCLAFNVLILVAPGAVGLASEADIEAVRAEVAATEAAQDARAQELLAATSLVTRRSAAAAAVPAICATVAEVGGWAFPTGVAPDLECPPAP